MVKQYIYNIGIWMNHAIACLIGKDPRMSLSAVAGLHDIRWLVRVANTLYRDEEHCSKAARIWKTPEGIAADRSLWK